LDTVTSSDGTTIAFERKGDGPAVILVSGALRDRSHPTQRELTAQLARRFTVFNYDRRGRGDSSDTRPYSVHREVEDIDALICKAGGSAFVYGASSGALLALEAAASGLAIAKLALFEPPFVVDAGSPLLPEDYPHRIDEAVTSGNPARAVEMFLTTALGIPDELLGPMKAEPSWSEMERLAHTLVYDGAIMRGSMSGDPPSRDRWAAASVPTLVINGQLSDDAVHAAARALCCVLVHARRRCLEDQESAPAPEVLAPVLREFFAPEPTFREIVG